MPETLRLSGALAFLAAITLASITGCSHHGDIKSGKDDVRPEPMAAFDTIAERAAVRDIDFMQSHVAAKLVKVEKRKPGEPDLIQRLCDELSFSRALRVRPTDDSRRVVIEASRLAPGLLGASAWQYSIDLYYNGRSGWQIASLPYDQRPINLAFGSP